MPDGLMHQVQGLDSGLACWQLSVCKFGISGQLLQDSFKLKSFGLHPMNWKIQLWVSFTPPPSAPFIDGLTYGIGPCT